MPGAVLRQDLRYGRLWLALGIGYAGIIVWLSLVSLQKFSLSFELWDKALHFLAYAGLGGWFCALLVQGAHRWVLVSACLLGVLLEVAQGWSGWRSFEWADMLANVLGATGGMLLARSPMGNAFALIEQAIDAARRRP